MRKVGKRIGLGFTVAMILGLVAAWEAGDYVGGMVRISLKPALTLETHTRWGQATHTVRLPIDEESLNKLRNSLPKLFLQDETGKQVFVPDWSATADGITIQRPAELQDVRYELLIAMFSDESELSFPVNLDLREKAHP